MSNRTEPGSERAAGIGHAAPERMVAAFAILAWLTVLGVVLQAVWAGEFLGKAGSGFVQFHQITAYVLVVLSLAAAILAGAQLRHTRPALMWPGIGLFVLMIIQTGLGQAASQDGPHALIAAHIPVAMLIMGLSVYLAIASAWLRRRIAPAA
ncbi:MAG: hypothetical protein ACRDRN_00270 [Sciscionella sp.]